MKSRFVNRLVLGLLITMALPAGLLATAVPVNCAAQLAGVADSQTQPPAAASESLFRRLRTVMLAPFARFGALQIGPSSELVGDSVISRVLPDMTRRLRDRFDPETVNEILTKVRLILIAELHDAKLIEDADGSVFGFKHIEIQKNWTEEELSKMEAVLFVVNEKADAMLRAEFPDVYEAIRASRRSGDLGQPLLVFAGFAASLLEAHFEAQNIPENIGLGLLSRRGGGRAKAEAHFLRVKKYSEILVAEFLQAGVGEVFLDGPALSLPVYAMMRSAQSPQDVSRGLEDLLSKSANQLAPDLIEKWAERIWGLKQSLEFLTPPPRFDETSLTRIHHASDIRSIDVPRSATHFIRVDGKQVGAKLLQEVHAHVLSGGDLLKISIDRTASELSRNLRRAIDGVSAVYGDRLLGQFVTGDEILFWLRLEDGFDVREAPDFEPQMRLSAGSILSPLGIQLPLKAQGHLSDISEKALKIVEKKVPEDSSVRFITFLQQNSEGWLHLSVVASGDVSESLRSFIELSLKELLVREFREDPELQHLRVDLLFTE